MRTWIVTSRGRTMMVKQRHISSHTHCAQHTQTHTHCAQHTHTNIHTVLNTHPHTHTHTHTHTHSLLVLLPFNSCRYRIWELQFHLSLPNPTVSVTKYEVIEIR